jgi:hypothetical protein
MQALKEEGFPDDQVKELVKGAIRQRREKIEKTLSRMLCYKNGKLNHHLTPLELYLLPWCIDQWRKWTRHRKLMRYWLNYVTIKTSHKRPMIETFNKWKNLDQEQKEQL